MGFETRVAPEDTVDSALAAARFLRENERLTGEMRARLPTNRELLNKIYEYGLQPV
jgi:hypothetical protein